MSQGGEIEKLEEGLYMDPNQMKDEYFLTQYRCKKGIFSHETALFFHDSTDRTPLQLMLTIPSGYNTRLLEEKENNLVANTLLQNFMMKRFLERIAVSKYKDNFILKGGFLLLR